MSSRKERPRRAAHTTSRTGAPERSATRACAYKPFTAISTALATAHTPAIATNVQHAERSTLLLPGLRVEASMARVHASTGAADLASARPGANVRPA